MPMAVGALLLFPLLDELELELASWGKAMFRDSGEIGERVMGRKRRTGGSDEGGMTRRDMGELLGGTA